MKRTLTAVLTILAVTQAVPLHRVERQILDLDDPAASNLTANEVCFSDNDIYQRGDIVPNPGPCEQCKCEPPSIVCNMIKCPVNSGCRTIQRANHCCPDYKCDCEHNGDIYNNGERIDTPDEPCQVCYCKGGEVMCTSITCYQRDDCEPQLVPGQCCPKYDHCPLRDMPSSNEKDERSGMKNKTYVNSPKREMQPWLLTKSVYINSRPTLTTQRNVEEITTEKPTELQTEVIISDWLTERKTTTEEGADNGNPEETTSTLDVTTLILDSNVIKQNKQETSTQNNEELNTVVQDVETTTQGFNGNNIEEKELESEEIEHQTKIDLHIDYSTATTTTGEPNDVSDNTKSIYNNLENSKTTNTLSINSKVHESETTKQPDEDFLTTKASETTTIEENPIEYNDQPKPEETKTEVIDVTTVNPTTDSKFNEKDIMSNDFTVTNKATEAIIRSTPSENESEGKPSPSSDLFSDFEIPQQNNKSTNEKRSGVKYEGSGEDSIDDSDDNDSKLHKELSEDFEIAETTKFADYSVVYTTPFTVEAHIVEGGSNKILSPDAENEIKENSSIVENVNHQIVFDQTEEPVANTKIEEDNITTKEASTLPNSEIIDDNISNNNRSDLKQSTVVSNNVLSKNNDNLPGSGKIEALQNSSSRSKDESTKKGDDTEVTTLNSEHFTTELETTTKPQEINDNLKEVLTKEDPNESEMEEDSVEEKNNVKKNSEEFEAKGSNEEEEDSQLTPVLELDNQLPFLQLGGHGSSESSTSESYSSEINMKENNIKIDEDNSNDHPSVRKVPEFQTTEGNRQSNISTHITLTPGDLKILAEYLINEKIKPIGRPSKNESSDYIPTEWLKGNLTSDVKIASILTAANISIGIMNKTDSENKIKHLEGVEHLINVGKTVDIKDSQQTETKSKGKEDTEKEDLLREEVKTESEEHSTDKIDRSTISTKLSLLADKSTDHFENSEMENKDHENDQSVTDSQETQTEKINFETEIFEMVTAVNSEPRNKSNIDEKTDKTATEQIMSTIIPKILTNDQTTENINNSDETVTGATKLKEKISDVSASRNVRIPEVASIVKEPFSVNLEDNDLTIVRDFLKKHMVIP